MTDEELNKAIAVELGVLRWTWLDGTHYPDTAPYCMYYDSVRLALEKLDAEVNVRFAKALEARALVESKHIHQLTPRIWAETLLGVLVAVGELPDLVVCQVCGSTRLRPARPPVGTRVRHKRLGSGTIFSYECCEEGACGVNFGGGRKYCLSLQDLEITGPPKGRRNKS